MISATLLADISGKASLIQITSSMFDNELIFVAWAYNFLTLEEVFFLILYVVLFLFNFNKSKGIGIEGEIIIEIGMAAGAGAGVVCL